MKSKSINIHAGYEKRESCINLIRYTNLVSANNLLYKNDAQKIFTFFKSNLPIGMLTESKKLLKENA